MLKRGLPSVRTNLLLIGIVLCAIAFVVLYSYATYTPSTDLPDDEPIDEPNDPPVIIPVDPSIPTDIPGIPPGDDDDDDNGSSGSSNTSAPKLTIDSPSDNSIVGNPNLTIKYSVRRFSSQSCWYVFDDSEGSIPNCVRSFSFNTTLGEHTLSIYANDSNGTVIEDHSTFRVVDGVPAIVLNGPSNDAYRNESEVQFFYTPTHNSLETCSLWGTFNGNYAQVASSSATNGTINSLNRSLGDGTYQWAIECMATNGASSITSNRTLTVDTTVPSLSVQQPTGLQSSSTIQVRVTASDAHLSSACTYSVTNSLGGPVFINGLPFGLFAGCNETTFTVPSPGNYTIRVTASDRAGNSVTVASTFTAPAPSTLLLNYPLATISGSTTPDASLYNHPGTVVGAQVSTPSIFGPVLVFGPMSYINSNTDIDLGRAFTLTTWIKLNFLPNNTGDGSYRLIDKSLNGANYTSYSLLINGTGNVVGRYFYANEATSMVEVVSPQALEIGKWYMVGFTSTDNGAGASVTLQVYINDTLAASRSGGVSQGPYNNEVPVVVGGQRSTGSPAIINSFRGYMHDARIYNRTLSIGEIGQLYDGVDIRLAPEDTPFFKTWALVVLYILAAILIVLVVMLFIGLRREKNARKNTPAVSPQRPPMPPYPPYRPGMPPARMPPRPMPRPVAQPIKK